MYYDQDKGNSRRGLSIFQSNGMQIKIGYMNDGLKAGKNVNPDGTAGNVL